MIPAYGKRLRDGCWARLCGVLILGLSGTGLWAAGATELRIDGWEDGAIRLSYTRPAGGAGITGYNYTVDGLRYQLQQDADLAGTWQTGLLRVETIETGPENGMESVELSVPEGLQPGAARFFRLVTEAVDSGEAPGIPSLAEAGLQPEPAFADDFEPGWEEVQTAWRVATWLQNGTQMSPERCRTDGEGHMVQTVLAGGPPYYGGSMETEGEYGWGRWVARVRPSPVYGVLNSVFIKDWDNRETPEDDGDGTKAEIDFEFLSYSYGPGYGEVHIAVHFADAKPLWEMDIPLDFNPSDAFHEWGFDILPDRVIWHVDGKFLHEWIYTDTHAMNENYEFFFNSWTKPTWILGPPSEDAHYHIDWVRFYPLR
jgi:hypothetical protein